MLEKPQENLLSKVAAFGIGFTTIFLLSDSVTDPVNVTKFLTLGVTAFAILGILIGSGIRRIFLSNLFLWVISGLFLAASAISVLMSQSPFSQSIYGTFGRNNGFLTYLFLVILLIGIAAFSQQKSLMRLLGAFFFAGIVNIIYCFWVLTFGDFIGWNNPYGNILGTFGNPNFVGSFLGIFIAVSLAYALDSDISKWVRITLILLIPITAFEIYKSSAIQGRIVGLLGISIVIFLYVRARASKVITYTFSGLVTIVFSLAVLGALQLGPLTSIIYKNSVSLRGQYWLAAWNTGNAHPFTGVGMDAFGDWYRRYRDFQALKTPGVNTVVDAAHNVPLDMFAFGGWPLFVIYLSLMLLSAVSLVKLILRSEIYDPILSVIVVAWIGYQVQSIISINQIGLAIWGWALSGMAISYEKITRKQPELEPQVHRKKMSKRSNNLNHSSVTVLSMTIFSIVGLILSLPPLLADTKLRNAQVVQTVQALEATMKPTYFNPMNSTKYISNIQTLEQNNFSDLAHKYALEAVNWNSNSFNLWKILYLIKDSTEQERKIALNNMKRLDPKNPDVTAAQ